LTVRSTLVQYVSQQACFVRIGITPLNERGRDVVGNPLSVVAEVFDLNHNPVLDGTAVYFTATHGMITGTAGSPAAGVALSLTSGGKAPATLFTAADGNADPAFDGIVTVRAAVGSPPTGVSGAANCIFSGPADPGTSSASVAPDTIPAVGGQAIISVTALDVMGNPVVDGSEVRFRFAGTPPGPRPASLNTSATTLGGTARSIMTTSGDPLNPSNVGPYSIEVQIVVQHGPTVVLTLPLLTVTVVP